MREFLLQQGFLRVRQFEDGRAKACFLNVRLHGY
jgi:hypothetical protein